MILYHMSGGLNCGLDTVIASYGRDADDHRLATDDKVIKILYNNWCALNHANLLFKRLLLLPMLVGLLLGDKMPIIRNGMLTRLEYKSQLTIRTHNSKSYIDHINVIFEL